MGGWVGDGAALEPGSRQHAALDVPPTSSTVGLPAVLSWRRLPCLLPVCLQRLPVILLEVIKEEKLGGLPLYALGASSGGSIVLRLAQIMPEVQVRNHGTG